jgi:hypothetical protein
MSNVLLRRIRLPSTAETWELLLERFDLDDVPADELAFIAVWSRTRSGASSASCRIGIVTVTDVDQIETSVRDRLAGGHARSKPRRSGSTTSRAGSPCCTRCSSCVARTRSPSGPLMLGVRSDTGRDAIAAVHPDKPVAKAARKALFKLSSAGS